MAQTSWPFENIDTSESQYSALFSYFQDNGVAGDASGASTLNVTTTTGLGLSVAAGFAVIRGFAYQNTSAVALTVDTANSQPRVDTVVLRLDPSANTIVAAVKKGTAAASPSAPALTQIAGGVWEMPLADVYLSANATSLSPGDLVDRRGFLGARVGLWSPESRPDAPRLGQFGYNTTFGKFEMWDGSAWTFSLPMDVTLADGSVTNAKLAGSIADSKLVTPPGKYVSVGNQPSATAFSVSNGDRGRLIVTGNSVGVTITINSGLAAGERIDFIQDGTGQITFAAGSGVTISSKNGYLKSSGQYAAVTAVAVGLNNIRLVGDLTA